MKKIYIYIYKDIKKYVLSHIIYYGAVFELWVLKNNLENEYDYVKRFSFYLNTL